MQTPPSVSIVMAAYNAGVFIHNAIHSVQNQTLADWELIIIDDNSTDNTAEIIAATIRTDTRIKYHRIPENKGPSAARNIGFALATGDYITILDSDDRFERDRLEVLINYAKLHEADIIADNISCFSEIIGKPIRKAFNFNVKTMLLSPEFMACNDGPPRLSSVGLLQPLIKRSFWKNSGVTYNENIKAGEDFCFMFLLLLQTPKAYLLNYIGYIYNLPFCNISSKDSSTTRTDYTVSGVETITQSNDYLIDIIRAKMPENTKLVTMLLQRKQRFLNELRWRKIKYHVKQKELKLAIILLFDADMLPYLKGLFRKKVLKSDAALVSPKRN